MVSEVIFDPYSDVYFDDPYDLYKRLRDEAPVSYNPTYKFYTYSRYADVVEASRDWSTYSNEWGHAATQVHLPERPPMAPGSILTIDPPMHERLRKLVNRSFTPRAAQKFETIIRGVIQEKADATAGQKVVDWVAEFAALFPVEVICSILGAPKADHQMLRHWVDEQLTINPLKPMDTGDIQRAMRSFNYFLELAKEKRKNPGDDMMSELITAQVEEEGDETRPLSDEEVAGFSSLIAAAGAETVTKLLGSTVFLLDKNPDQLAKLKANRNLIPKAVDEANRYFAPSQYQGRHTMKDVTIHGTDIPAGSGVILITGAATRDERQFANPDTYDIERDIPVQISFGHGIHYCLGVYLAKLESKIAIETLLDRWPDFKVDHDNTKRVKMSNVSGFCNLPMFV